MTLARCSCLVLIVLMLFASTAGATKDSLAKAKRPRILSSEKPNSTTPIPVREAKGVDDLERGIEADSLRQTELKSGQIKQEDFDKARAAFAAQIEDASAKNPDSAPVQTSAARAYIQTGDNKKAAERATSAMALAPSDPFPVTTRSLAYYKDGDYPKAAEDAKRALALDPNDAPARALWLLSKDRAKGGTILGAADTKVKHVMDELALPANPRLDLAGPADDKDPELAKYKTPQGREYGRKIVRAERALWRKDYLTAYGMANDAMQTFADNPRLLAARAVAAFGLKDFKTAEGDASLVLKAKPGFYSMLTTRAAARNELGRHSDALRDARAALALAPPKDARPHLELAIAREGLRDDPVAVLEGYKTAAELDPSFTPDYLQALARLKPGQAAATGEATDAARADAPGAGSADAAIFRAALPPGFPVKAAAASAALLALLALGLAASRRKPE